MKIEENERLAALLTAKAMPDARTVIDVPMREQARLWRESYLEVLAEFMELEKAAAVKSVQ